MQASLRGVGEYMYHCRVFKADPLVNSMPPAPASRPRASFVHGFEKGFRV